MESENVTLEQVLKLAKQLSPLEKVQLIEQVAPDLEAPLEAFSKGKRPLQSAYGICADLGPAPSAEEIDEVRKEIFKNFPREEPPCAGYVGASYRYPQES